MDRDFIARWLDKAEQLADPKQVEKRVSNLEPTSEPLRIALARIGIEISEHTHAFHKAFDMENAADEEELAKLTKQMEARSARMQAAIVSDGEAEISVEALVQVQNALEGEDRELFVSLMNWRTKLFYLLRDDEMVDAVLSEITEFLHLTVGIRSRLSELGII